MHKMVRNARKARAWAKVNRAKWAWYRFHQVASWDGMDADAVSWYIQRVWQARWAARAAR